MGGTSWRDVDDIEVHSDCRCSGNKINNSVDCIYLSWEPNSCSSADFNSWWKVEFAGVPNAISSTKDLFIQWGLGLILVKKKRRRIPPG